jgi:hypothetical protein
MLNLVNKKGLPDWKLAYSFSVYIILPENTHQYLFTAADNSLPGTLAFYRIVNISNDQQMSLISHFRSFNSSFKKCRLKFANREWKMFHGELSAAANKY